MDKIKQYTPEGIVIISQGEIVAKSLKNYLNRHENLDTTLTITGAQKFYTTGNINDFNDHASLFFGAPVSCEQAFLG